MLRTGRNNIVYSGQVSWSSGSTVTSALTISASVTSTQTTILHEVIFTTNCTSAITADIRPVTTIGGSSYIGEIGASVTISGVTTVKGLSVDAIHTQIKGLFNNSTIKIGLLLASIATSTVTVNCIIRELEGT